VDEPRLRVGSTDKLSPLGSANHNKGVYWRVWAYNCRYFFVAALQVVLKSTTLVELLEAYNSGVYSNCLRFLVPGAFQRTNISTFQYLLTHLRLVREHRYSKLLTFHPNYYPIPSIHCSPQSSPQPLTHLLPLSQSWSLSFDQQTPDPYLLPH
jgi:hypothetical protein